MKISDSPKWIFQVIEQSEAEDQVEGAHFCDRQLFGIPGQKSNLRVASLPF
jgi:hypothetical protein